MEGFIYSFNGPHSLFIDTIRSLRSLALAHQLGHVLMGEHDSRISLLERLIDMRRPLQSTPFIMEKAGTPTTCRAAPRTRAFST